MCTGDAWSGFGFGFDHLQISSERIIPHCRKDDHKEGSRYIRAALCHTHMHATNHLDSLRGVLDLMFKCLRVGHLDGLTLLTPWVSTNINRGSWSVNARYRRYILVSPSLCLKEFERCFGDGYTCIASRNVRKVLPSRHAKEWEGSRWAES